MLYKISESQKKEIENLAKNHADSLIAFGASLYREGLIKGAIIGGGSVMLGLISSKVIDMIRQHKNDSTEES
jgi:hypothetical protein